MCRFDGGNDVWMQESGFERLCDVIDGDSVGVEMLHDCVHERGPRKGGSELVEKVGETHLVDDPSVTVVVDNGSIEVENHH